MVNSVGDKFAQVDGKDITEIAKLIKADIVQAFPNYKVSVRTSRFAFGQSLNIDVSGTGFVSQTNRNKTTQKQVEAIANKYRYDARDPLLDGIQLGATNFYLYVRVTP